MRSHSLKKIISPQEIDGAESACEINCLSVADFRNKLFSFACLSSRSARGYFVFNPETTLFSPYISLSSFLRRGHVGSLRRAASHFSREPRRFITPTYFSVLNVLRSFSLSHSRHLLCSFRQRSPFSFLFFVVRGIFRAHGVPLFSLSFSTLIITFDSLFGCV